LTNTKQLGNLPNKKKSPHDEKTFHQLGRLDQATQLDQLRNHSYWNNCEPCPRFAKATTPLFCGDGGSAIVNGQCGPNGGKVK
jgi:hypothetical protein